MASTIDRSSLLAWCSLPPDELANSKDAKVPVTVLASPDDVHRWTAADMLAEVRRNNELGAPTRWILPCGPTGQYRYFTEAVNETGTSLRSVHVFHMDELLTWDCRPVPLDHPFSFEGWMTRHFYDPVAPDLVIPPQQRHFPRPGRIDDTIEAIDAVGGIDTTYGGIGFRGHIAFNEPPDAPWSTVGVAEYRTSRTRILALNDDTIVALSQRVVGGCSHLVPPMAVTLGMSELLRAARIRLICETGSWKQTVVRILLFGPVTVEYPVTLVQGHPDVLLVIDRATAEHPLARM